jgi:hypothetical protein
MMPLTINSFSENMALNAALPGNDLLRIQTIRDPQSPLLVKVYNELVVPLFSNPNDVDALSSIQKYMQNETKLSSNCICYLCIAVIDTNEQVLGATLFGLFSMGAYAFIKGEYTVIKPEARQQGTLEKLLRSRLCICKQECTSRGLELGFATIQVCSNDNDLYHRNLQRLWRLQGFRRLDFPFIQLPLRDDLQAITSFDLFFQPIADEFFLRTHLTKDEIRAIVDASYTFRDSTTGPSQYEEYHRMQLYIDTKKSIPICQQ